HGNARGDLSCISRRKLQRCSAGCDYQLRFRDGDGVFDTGICAELADQLLGMRIHEAVDSGRDRAVLRMACAHRAAERYGKREALPKIAESNFWRHAVAARRVAARDGRPQTITSHHDLDLCSRGRAKQFRAGADTLGLFPPERILTL